MTKSSQITTAVFVTVLAVATGWAAWSLFWPYGLTVYVPMLAWASRKGTKPAIASVALSPFILVPIIFLGMGAYAFLQGTAVLRVRGLPTVESTNLEPRHRVPMVTTALRTDARHGFGWLAYEAGVRLTGTLAGPMRGAYAGPYPSRAQAWRSLDAAPDAFVEGGVIRVGDRFATLPVGVDLRHAASLRAHRIGETLIIGHPDQLWLLVERTQAVFATWRRGDNAPPRFSWPNQTPAPLPSPAVADGPRPYASPAY